MHGEEVKVVNPHTGTFKMLQGIIRARNLQTGESHGRGVRSHVSTLWSKRAFLRGDI